MTTLTAKLENWSTFLEGGVFTAPEHRELCLQGQVFDHPSHEDGDNVSTSAIKEAEGCSVKTQSGTRYQLGKPNPEWLKWLEEKGKSFDPGCPIKLNSRRTA